MVELELIPSASEIGSVRQLLTLGLRRVPLVTYPNIFAIVSCKSSNCMFLWNIFFCKLLTITLESTIAYEITTHTYLLQR